MPSCLETFGHPLLEAMASEVPVVASDLPVFREVAADAAFYADPHNPESLAGAMEAALFLTGAREMLVKRGRERVREFTWERSAERLLSLFHEVIAEREGRAHRRRTPALGVVAPLRASCVRLPQRPPADRDWALTQLRWEDTRLRADSA